MHRTIASLPFAPSVKMKLTRAGFDTCADLKDLRPLQLCKEAGVSQEEALEVLQTLRSDDGVGVVSHVGVASVVRGGLTALQLLQKEHALGDIITFCSALDSALGGGVPVGKTTEVCGAPGVGKTQLCLQLAVDVQIPVCFGGRGGQVLYIDTEGSFLVQRAADMAQAAVEHCRLVTQDDEQKAALKDFTVENILSRLSLVRCHDYVELLAHCYLLPDLLTKHSEVVLTNQMTTKVWNGQSKLIPALGESWGHAATQRLILHWEGTQRLASIYKSPSQMEATVPYRITEDGFRDMAPPPFSTALPTSSGPTRSDSQSQQSKRPRMEPRPSS
ncbi:DNA repair protein RAD51 homolog 3 isoform X2 [Sardina pilchardus]|uniref:DNA repair protein RAD51 homolog 3 isoform X2 n=1 Tax=Sardina pilchardus TaxID=27697 RepID=UPI002E1618E4